MPSSIRWLIFFMMYQRRWLTALGLAANRVNPITYLGRHAPSRRGRRCQPEFSLGAMTGFSLANSSGGLRGSGSVYRWTRCLADISLRSVNRRNWLHDWFLMSKRRVPANNSTQRTAGAPPLMRNVKRLLGSANGRKGVGSGVGGLLSATRPYSYCRPIPV